MRMFLQITIVLTALAGALGAASTAVAAEGEEGQKAVLVTGASSGIGRKITEALAGNGHFVYAGARKDKDLAELNQIDNVESIRLDVTVQDDIDAALLYITEAGRGLYGIVNNAGVSVVGPMNETPEKDLDFVFDVNVYGPYRINKTFTPLLVASKGRTVTISSIMGFVSIAENGVYAMSKFAMEAYTDALAAEMADSGVLAILIEPGAFKSEIWIKDILHSMGKDPDNPGKLTEEEQARIEEAMAEYSGLQEPDAVAEAVAQALFSEKPRPRYMVPSSQRQAQIVIRTMLTKVAQINTGQPYSYSLEDLQDMLAEAVAAQ